MHFGQRLKQLREAQSLSQTDLAARINVSSSAISRIEKGERDPELYTVFELAKGLGMTVRDLIEPLDTPTQTAKEVTYMSDQAKLSDLEEKLLTAAIDLLETDYNNPYRKLEPEEQFRRNLETTFQVYAVVANTKNQQGSTVHVTSAIQPLTDEQINQIGTRIVELVRRNGIKL